MTKQPCYIGCPVWACEKWVGSLYSSSHRRCWLSEYSQVFNTVEANSSFYALPTLDTVSRWAGETRDGFRFSLKFPRVISHELQLVDAEAETELFLELLAVLHAADRLGPSFLQLPPWFSASEFTKLANYLTNLPHDFPFSVEVRHLDYFNHSVHELELNDLLGDLGMDRVIFDSRALFSAPPSDEFERKSQTRKPDLPIRQVSTGARPMLRIVGRNATAIAQPWIDEWTPVIAEWIRQGKTPYIFTHSPNDEFAPTFAARFHASLRRQLPTIPPLPESWPGAARQRQQTLF